MTGSAQRNHVCQCQGTDRLLGLVLGQYLDDNQAIRDAAERFGWTCDWSLGAAAVPVGPSAPIDGPAALRDLLSGILGPSAVDTIGAAWLPDTNLVEHAGTLMRADPLPALAPQRDSPLARILDEETIETWFQPVLRADTLETWGYECLMRARDPDDGTLVSPGRILDWARAENLLFTLDRVCRETHVRNASARCGGTGLRALINFQPTVIYQPEFCLRTTVEALDEPTMSPGQVIFEVVETDRIDDHDHLRDILAYYRNHGFGVALDDLSAGYSGLSLLADLDPDLVKIDREIVWRAVDSEGHADVCRAVVDYARKRGREVLAEGIETEAQKQLMLDMGVDLLQGFLFGRPEP